MDKFHELCNDKGNTLIIIKSEHNLIFSAYCDKPWNINGKIEGDGKSFLFSLTKNIKSLCKEKEIYGGSSSFALGGDMIYSLTIIVTWLKIVIQI